MIEPPSLESAPTLSPDRRGSSILGIVLAAFAGLGLLAAGAEFADFVFKHRYQLSTLSGLKAHQKFGVLSSGVNEFARLLSQAAAACAGWLALVALAEWLIEVIRRQGTEGTLANSTPRADERSRWAAAVFLSLVCCVIVSGAYLTLERERYWTEWVTLGTVGLAGVFGATRLLDQHPYRLPRALLPITLATSSFFFGVASVASHWSYFAFFLMYNNGTPVTDRDALLAHANRPIGSLALIAPVLVLLIFAAFRWAQGSRTSSPIRSRAPLILAVGALIVAFAYAGLDRRVRADLAVYTGGSGSNEDLLAYVRVSREVVYPKPEPLE